MLLKVVITVGIALLYALAFIWLHFMYLGDAGGLDPESDRVAIRRADAKAALRLLVTTALAALALAFVWDWISV